MECDMRCIRREQHRLAPRISTTIAFCVPDSGAAAKPSSCWIAEGLVHDRPNSLLAHIDHDGGRCVESVVTARTIGHPSIDVVLKQANLRVMKARIIVDTSPTRNHPR